MLTSCPVCLYVAKCNNTVGPLARTQYMDQAVQHISRIQDSFTRYGVAVPVLDLEAEAAARALRDSWIMIHGVPEQVHTDRGTGFTSNVHMAAIDVLRIPKIPLATIE